MSSINNNNNNNNNKSYNVIIVLFHAALLGRTDVVQNAISSIKALEGEEQTSRIISTGRPEDGCSPLHVAALFGHTDVIRALLVYFISLITIL